MANVRICFLNRSFFTTDIFQANWLKNKFLKSDNFMILPFSSILTRSNYFCPDIGKMFNISAAWIVVYFGFVSFYFAKTLFMNPTWPLENLNTMSDANGAWNPRSKRLHDRIDLTLNLKNIIIADNQWQIHLFRLFITLKTPSYTFNCAIFII